MIAVSNAVSGINSAVSSTIQGSSIVASDKSTTSSPLAFMRSMMDGIASADKSITSTINSDYSLMDISKVRRVQLELENYNIGAQLFSKVVSGVVKDIDALIKIQ